MNEFLEQFLVESRELSEVATRHLLALEEAPENRENLDGAFRALHTLKGGAGIVDFMAMSRAVHAAEDALSAVRAGDRAISTELIGDCLCCVDQVVQWLDETEAAGDLPTAADKASETIIARFGYEAEPARQDEARQDEAKRPGNSRGVLSATARRILEEQLLLIAETAAAGREGRVASAARVAANVVMQASLEFYAAPILRAGLDANAIADAIANALREQSLGADSTASRSDAAARNLRVDAKRVDELVNITGELTIAKNAIAHIAKVAEEGGNTLAPALRYEHARLDRLTTGLQYAVLSLRVLPLRTVFRRFTRFVRELAVSLGKPAVLTMEGEDTEADRAIVEMLFEPLLHVVRNAMDHGIETAPERAAAGKPASASIRLCAQRRGEHIVVEVRDDGRGIDVAHVRRAAAARRIVADEVLSAMSGPNVIDLIFMPGFSTADHVTGLSGRGVGMDAVRSSVERIGGRVTAESEPGRGSTVRFTLPFSVMITRVMTFEAGGQMFGVPLDAVVETVRLPRDQIQSIGEAGAFVLRDRTIPLIYLAKALGYGGERPAASEAITVIASISGQLGALEVDRIGERMDVILKPTEGLLAGTPGVAGTTLTGDGKVLLILDLQELLA
jgi:two-component system, chemotaxis family, sensor kinase CheA